MNTKAGIKQKRFWVIILTVLLFFAGAFLGFATVFRVNEVVVEVSAISEDAKTEAQDIRARLKKCYEDENIFVINDKGAKSIVADYPHFRIKGFRKDYPNRIVLTVTEDAEVYAVKQAGKEEYLILGADGTILAIRETPLNRLDGNANVVIEGLSVSGKKGEKVHGDNRLNVVLEFCNQLSEKLNGIRNNVLTVKIFDNAPQLHIYTQEGVKIYVAFPEQFTTQKADKIAEKYLALSDEERLSGCILSTDKGNEIYVEYQQKDISE